MSKWIFGYGSLLWKVDFKYRRKFVGYVKNYKRRFWLLSDDHRGTPENPGRVVTLVPSDDENDVVLGIAYEIEEDNVENTFRYLDYREKCGYTRHNVSFYNLDYNNEYYDESVKELVCICYYANDTNEYYSIENDNTRIAKQICTTIGPSGSNIEYLVNLCETLRFLSNRLHTNRYIDIERHMFDIEKLCKSSLKVT